MSDAPDRRWLAQRRIEGPLASPAAAAAALRLVAAATTAATLLAATTVAAAHDWYPAKCCSERDCYPVDPAELEPTGDGGWRIRATGEIARRQPDFTPLTPGEPSWYGDEPGGYGGNAMRYPPRRPALLDTPASARGFHRCSRDGDRRRESFCLFVPAEEF